jgi:hypothetical protein
MTIDRALSGDPFRVDQILCREAAQNLAGYVPAHQAEVWSDLPTLSQLVFKTLFVSICHQFNWDYLQNAMAQWLLPTPEAMLGGLEVVKSTEISRLLSGYSKPERIRAPQRAQMLRESARCLNRLVQDGVLQRLLETRQLAGPDGFYSAMQSIPAFSEDPLEKKVRVLAHDLHREAIIRFSDPENLRPAVEYHIIRLYLRSGRVYPVNDDVKELLRSKSLNPRGRLVKLLRTRVEEAMNFTSYYSGLNIATLNYLEWQIGRAVCIPDIPALCLDPPHRDLPPDVNAVCRSACAFSEFCRAFTQPSYGWYNEPQFQKAIY